MANKYWFARRFPAERGRSGMAPVSFEGWVVVAVFVSALVLGFGGLAFFGTNGQLFSGIAMCVLLALAGGTMFIGMANSRGDKINTVEDYRQGRVKP